MQRFTLSIEASLKAQNWLAALFLALALPDICAALEEPDRPVGERYKHWFQRYLRATYDPNSMYEMMETSAPEALAQLPPDIAESMKAQPAPKAAAFTSEDCYRLRCKCLHQGLPERMGEDRVHFTVPDLSGSMRLHRNSFGGVLQLSIDEFCRDVASAAMCWWEDAQAEPDVLARAGDLIKIYGLDAAELPIVSYGTPAALKE